MSRGDENIRNERRYDAESVRGYREEGDFGQKSRMRTGYSEVPAGFGRPGIHTGKGPKNYRRSDRRIEEDANECLLFHGEVDATDIEVKVEGGVVTLTGCVEDRRTRREAEMAIENIPGVVDVMNRLTLRHANPGAGARLDPLEDTSGFGGPKTTTEMM